MKYQIRRTHHWSSTLWSLLTAAQLHRKRRHRPLTRPQLRRILENTVPQSGQSGDHRRNGPEQHPIFRLTLLHRRQPEAGPFPVGCSASHGPNFSRNRQTVSVSGGIFPAVCEVDGENGSDTSAGWRCWGDQEELPHG